MDVQEHRPRRVRYLDRVHATAGELPDEPAADRACAELAALGAARRARHTIEDPADLRGREVRVDDETGALAHQRFEPTPPEVVADVRARAALPDHRRVDRATGVALPHDR